MAMPTIAPVDNFEELPDTSLVFAGLLSPFELVPDVESEFEGLVDEGDPGPNEKVVGESEVDEDVVGVLDNVDEVVVVDAEVAIAFTAAISNRDVLHWKNVEAPLSKTNSPYEG